MGSGSRQGAGRLQTEARVAAGDDRGAAGQVDPVEDVLRGAPGAEARSILCCGVVMTKTLGAELRSRARQLLAFASPLPVLSW